MVAITKERVLAFDRELDLVIGARQIAVFYLRLRDRALKVHVPHRRRIRSVDVPLVPEVPEGFLRRSPAMLVDRLVFLSPVDGETEPMPEHAECVLVLFDQADNTLR